MALPIQREDSMSHHSDWKSFTSEHCYFLFHVPSASILQVPTHLWQSLHTECSPQNLKEVQELASSLKNTESYTSPSISHIALNVVERCNLRCTYCYAGDGDYGKDSLMTFATAQRAIEYFAKSAPLLKITFFGGEPLLNFALIKNVVEWLESVGRSKPFFRFSITTNGLLLNEAHLNFFKTHDFEVKVSYDGKVLQETQRTKNAQVAEQIERKLKIFEEKIHQLRSFYLRTTVSREHLDSFAQNILETLHSHNYRLHYARVSNRTEQERFHLEDAEKLGTLWRLVIDRLVEEENWAALLRLGNFRNHLRKIHRGQAQAFCGAGLNYVSVSTIGRFYLCHRFTEDEEESLGDLEKGLDGAKLSELLVLRGNTKEPCRSCWMRNLCKGGCFHEHKMGTGNKGRIDPVFCKLQDMEMTLALQSYITLKKKAPRVLAEAVR